MSWTFKYKALNASTVDAVLNSEYNIFSIDVFDTAITRLLEAPVDVFALAEQSLVAAHGRAWKGFAVAREEAEIEARRRASAVGRDEVCLNDIYAAFADAQPGLAKGVATAKQAEIDAEVSVVAPVPEMVRFVERARAAGRRVVFVSDMYLGMAEIGSLLSRCGYDHSEGLLVSSETGKTKAAGTQWQVLRDLVGAEARILHVGDDPWSDVASPERHGIAGLLFEGARSERRVGGPLSPDILPFSRLSRAVTLARLQDDKRSQAADDPAAFMRDFGATWGAVVVGSFVRWLEERVTRHRIDHLAFCARDGFLVKQAWEASGAAARTGIPVNYLYVSRRTLHLAEAARPGQDGGLTDIALDKLCSGRQPLRTLLARSNLLDCGELVRDAEATLGSLDAFMEHGAQSGVFRGLLRKHQAEVLEALAPAAEATRQYLYQELPETGRIGVVDIGWHGTFQSILAKVLGERVCSPLFFGFYYGLWPAAQRVRPVAGLMEGAFGNDYYSLEEQFGLHNAVAILENLHLAGHGTTIGYQMRQSRWEPVLQESEVEKRQNSDLIAPFQTSTVAAVREIFQDENGRINPSELRLECGLAAISRIALGSTSEEISVLGSIKHANDYAHSTFQPLVRPPTAKEPEPLWPLMTDWPFANALMLKKLRTGEGNAPNEGDRIARIRSVEARLDPRSIRQLA